MTTHRSTTLLLGGFLALMGFLLFLGVQASQTPGRPPAPVASPTYLEATMSVPATGLTDGIYQVGRDIDLGTYRTTGESAGTGCYYERLVDLQDSADSRTAKAYSTGPMVMSVEEGDVYVNLAGGCVWTRD